MSWNIIITDGMEASGIEALKQRGFKVDVRAVTAAELPSVLPAYDGIIVRSATKVRADLIDQCPKLKFIARGGVGLDNIDVEHARQKGIAVINTPASSSRSVAELAMAHLLGITRSLQWSNRDLKDAASFTALKKQLSGAGEIAGRTLLLIGMGRIGRELARMAIGAGMEVIAFDPFIEHAQIELNIQGTSIEISIELVTFEEGLSRADYISLHSPYTGKKLLDENAFSKMKNGVFIINTSRGENLDEQALLDALESGRVRGAGLDVFEHEPGIDPRLIHHPQVSVSPHIGASTEDAQQRIAEELVEKIVDLTA
ncbi:MAG TPA: D-2-hydroxyacid dehydrogenase [Saprospiraceae bacterium]|nr:D-2-hydroxyacid dehydrogenase [Saprospiraceae bacterium]